MGDKGVPKGAKESQKGARSDKKSKNKVIKDRLHLGKVCSAMFVHFGAKMKQK